MLLSLLILADWVESCNAPLEDKPDPDKYRRRPIIFREIVAAPVSPTKLLKPAQILLTESNTFSGSAFVVCAGPIRAPDIKLRVSLPTP